MRTLSFLWLIVSWSVPVWAAPSPPAIAFSPQGVVKGVRQVSARFATPMVPLGDPRASRDPFEVDCAEKGSSRWIDERTWVFDFERDVPPGVVCRFTVRSDLIDLAKAPITSSPFSFSTGGPSVESMQPSEGDESIEEEQAFLLFLDAEPDPASLAGNVYLQVKGLPQAVAMRVLEGSERQAILSTQWEGQRRRPSVVVQATQRLPNDTKVVLVWGKGVRTKSGIANSQDQRFELKTRKRFAAEVGCERPSARAACIPLSPLRVDFSAPVPWGQASRVGIVGADGRRWTPRGEEDATASVSSLSFAPPFPESSSLRVEMPPDIKDDAGRPLANADRFPQSVKTGPYPPLAKFASRFGIVESSDPILPVTVRNLEASLAGSLWSSSPAAPGGATENPGVSGSVLRLGAGETQRIWPWLRRVSQARRARSLFADEPKLAGLGKWKLPKPNGGKAFEVVGIPLGKPGFYVVELASPSLGAALLGKKQPMYVATAALVTNLGVHFKWGSESSLVWVTKLDSAEPVPGARLRIEDCKGSVVWEGSTGEAGLARVPNLPGRETLPDCSSEMPRQADGFDIAEQYAHPALAALSSGLLVSASLDDDLAFVHSSWNEGIQPWRFQLPGPTTETALKAHTILDRSLLRAGETLHMKHLLRKQGQAGFVRIAEAERPQAVVLRHLGSDQRYDLPLQWQANDSAETVWQIPKEAKLGRYEIRLRRDGNPDEWWNQIPAGELRVQELRVPSMRALVQIPAQAQIAAPEVSVDLSASYLSGGAAANLPVVLRAQLQDYLPTLPELYESYAFARPRLVPGIQAQEEGDDEAGPAVHQRDELHLDVSGSARATVRAIPPSEVVRRLMVEMEYRDPNGEVQTVSSSVPVWPAASIAGIQADYWASTRNVTARVAVLDPSLRPRAGAPVVLTALRRTYYSHRKRLVGGFYGYDHVESIAEIGELCRGVTGENGIFECRTPPPGSGEILLQASVTDAQGRSATTHTSVYIEGEDPHWFPVDDSDRIDVLPEKPKYEPGEKARFQVRMPFPEATALVSIEREGVAEAFVAKLSGTDPVVEVPILPQYAPNVFVSVLAVRGRHGETQPTSMVDLGRPSFKLGIAEVRVGWSAHALEVAVRPEREAYKVRETARAQIEVRSALGSLAADAEVAIAVVDEGLLELAPNTSWNLLEAMMGRRGYDVSTATAQMQIVGKRHYGLKALPQGGGGGRQGTRELFDTLLLWKANVPLDASGHASVDIPLNDSLTAFRIVAIATSGNDRFGTGAATIRSTQELSVTSGLPGFAREGDRLHAEATVRNTSERPMRARASMVLTPSGFEHPQQELDLAPGEAKTLGWDIAVGGESKDLAYEIRVAEEGGASDAVKMPMRVLPAVPVRTLQSTLYRWGETVSAKDLEIEAPADAVAGRGGIRVEAAASLAGSLAGVEEWMRDYPYGCLEQRVSRAIALREDSLWKEVVAVLPSFLDDDGLLKYFASQATGSDILSAYVLSVSTAAGRELPGEIRTRLEQGLRTFVTGGIRRSSATGAADLVLRKLSAIRALAGSGQVEAELLDSLSVAPRLWPVSALLDWWEILERMPKLSRRDLHRREVEEILRSRLTLHGTILALSEEAAGDLPWLMVDGDGNAARLLLFVETFGLWNDDVGRLMRGLLQRQRRGRWSSTIANAWGRLAIDEFARRFEATAVDGSVRVALGGYEETLAWSQPPAMLGFDVPWPAAKQSLSVRHQGAGQPWVTLRANAAVPLTAPLWSGFQIRKTLTPIEAGTEGGLRRGDLVRVRLEVDVQNDMSWVVLHDPIPAGASHVGRGLARDSNLAQQGERQDGNRLPLFVEKPSEAYRAYYETLPKGRIVTEYTLRLNHRGSFHLPPTRVEAMYSPEVFGELPNPDVEVQE